MTLPPSSPPSTAPARRQRCCPVDDGFPPACARGCLAPGVRCCLQGGTRANLGRVTRQSTARLSLFLVISCASTGQYVWIEHYQQPVSPSQGYVIAPGDVISVRVYNQEGMSARERVRADGKLSLPFLNDVDAAGYTPTA